MRRETKIALAVGIPVVVGVGAYLAYKTLVAMRRYLFISVGEGGTTIPAPGTYTYKMGENVTITAFPDEGYTVGTWVVDGVEVARQVGSITVTMDVNHNVIVTFWKGGVPPPSYPAGIRSLGAVNVIGEIEAWVEGYPCINQHIRVQQTSAGEAEIGFEVLDPAEVGVPNVAVALWTDPMPDGSRYRGYLYLNGKIVTRDNPLVLNTDEKGRVYAKLSYAYGANDGFEAACRDTGLKYYYCGCIWPLSTGEGIARNCHSLVNLPWWWDWVSGRSGGGYTPMFGNRVYANVVGTLIGTFEVAYCGFHVKWI
jgi:hypothetical protein